MKTQRLLKLVCQPDLSKEPEYTFEGYDGRRRHIVDYNLTEDTITYNWPERPREALYRTVKIDTFARWASRCVDSMYNDKYGPRGFPVGNQIRKKRKKRRI